MLKETSSIPTSSQTQVVCRHFAKLKSSRIKHKTRTQALVILARVETETQLVILTSWKLKTTN